MRKPRLIRRRELIKQAAIGSTGPAVANSLWASDLGKTLSRSAKNGSAKTAAISDPPARGFQVPPPAAKPYAWWHWMDGNVTREGIVADLETMKRVGLGSAHFANVAYQIPPGDIRFDSPEWLVENKPRPSKRIAFAT